MDRRVRFEIRDNLAGQPLIDVLCARFSFCERERWLSMIEGGIVVLNGKHVSPDHVVQGGDMLVYRGEAIPEPEVNRKLVILHDDDHMLIVDKPAGLPAHPGGRFFNGTLWAILKEEHGIEKPVIINRLDRETSGLVIVAKTPQAEKSCRAQFEQRTVEKRYLAIVEGRFEGVVDARGWIRPDEAFPDRKRVRFDAALDAAITATDGKESEWSETKLIGKSVHGDLSLVAAYPKTGRMHQIRATLTGLGFPVVGDKLYGPDPGVFLRFCRSGLTDEDHRRLRIDRQALHAAFLRFRHPGRGGWVEFECPLPEELQRLISGGVGPMDPPSVSVKY